MNLDDIDWTAIASGATTTAASTSPTPTIASVAAACRKIKELFPEPLVPETLCCDPGVYDQLVKLARESDPVGPFMPPQVAMMPYDRFAGYAVHVIPEMTGWKIMPTKDVEAFREKCREENRERTMRQVEEWRDRLFGRGRFDVDW